MYSALTERRACAESQPIRRPEHVCRDWPEGFRTGVRRGVRSRVRRGSGGNDPPPDPPPVSLCVGTGQINGQ
eukprot:1480280-Pyramimonas_sp.AAC.1